jgi:predicted dithiol-disulfide oxidoreductase (DUF899 family)
MNAEIDQLQKQIDDLKKQLSAARRKVTPQPVKDYTLTRPDGTPVKLSELFGSKPDLLVIHNMGSGCPYCTVWADGIQSLGDHVLNRTAFVIVSPDEPAKIKEFAASRGWRLPMASGRGTTFTHDMGYEPEPGQCWPGVSGFRKREDGSMVRTGKAIFGPGDDFCPLWHLFDLLEGGTGNWTPRYSYKA